MDGIGADYPAYLNATPQTRPALHIGINRRFNSRFEAKREAKPGGQYARCHGCAERAGLADEDPVPADRNPPYRCRIIALRAEESERLEPYSLRIRQCRPTVAPADETE